ncbi:DNA-binding protein [Thermocladium modestius]|nr:DNA-binding protein [Thermocladium modestius]
MDDELRLLKLKKMMELMKAAKPGGSGKELSDSDAVNIVRGMVVGDRGAEIIDKAISLYDGSVLPLFKYLAEKKMSGGIQSIRDDELYALLDNMGFHIPLDTRIRIVRHGREEKLGD